MKQYLAELIGTFTLVMVGCMAITASGHGAVLGSGAPLAPLAILPIALAFGLAVTAMAYGIGPVSGAHLNPAVTLGVWASGRMPTAKVPGYIIAQVLGAFTATGLMVFLLKQGAGGWDITKQGVGQTTFSNYSALGAFLAEFTATFLFVVVILGVTSKAGATAIAGLAIGLTLTVMHLAFINVTGSSLNPARSLAPAVYVGNPALAQVWLYLVAPSLGGLVAGFLFKAKVLEAEA